MAGSSAPRRGHRAHRWKNLIAAHATLDELQQLDVRTWKGEQWRGERIPHLAEILEAMPAGKRIFLELKCGPGINIDTFQIARIRGISWRNLTKEYYSAVSGGTDTEKQ